MESVNKKNDDIQILRCIAILFVMLVHSIIIIPQDYSHFYFSIKKVFNTGSGVDLFFVMAGFFLSLSLSKFEGSGKVKAFSSFIVKKFKRLSPAAYLWSAIPLLMSFIMPNTYWLSVHDMMIKFLSSVFYLRNFEEVRLTSVFGYFWALGLEFQVFVAFSFIHIFFGRKAYFCSACAVCFTMLFYRPGGVYSWMFRYDSMLYGVLLYLIIVEKGAFNGLLSRISSQQSLKAVLSILLITLLAASFNIPSDKFNITVLSSIISCVLMAIALNGEGIFGWLPSHIYSMMRVIGNRSYSLFCCHIPSWILTLQVLQGHVSDPAIILLAQLLVMLIFSEITYRFVENVFVRKIKSGD
jgi:peptidoglycan/LPS O-acetylase OafA/YrhL